MYRIIYNIIIILLLPFLTIFMNIPKKNKKGYGFRYLEFLGIIKERKLKKTKTLWFHSASVGETIAIIPLLKKIHENYPNYNIVVTTFTTTGAAQISSLDFVSHIFAPLDCYFSIKSFIKKINPSILLIVERELWPNWLHYCQNNNIPIYIINGRMSERSCQKYIKIFPIFSKLIGSKINGVFCQNALDASRFKRLGIDNIQIFGSLKFDFTPLKQKIDHGIQLRKSIKANFVWIAASTHEGEEEKIIQAHNIILKKYPSTLLIMCPRHPQRFSSVKKLCESNNFTVKSFSENPTVIENTKIYLCDTMGELITMFTASDVVFMGGSLVDIGGHNPIEPAALAKPIITGDFDYNFSDIFEKLHESHALIRIKNENELAQAVITLFENKDAISQMGTQALDVVVANQGATQKTLEQIINILES